MAIFHGIMAGLRWEARNDWASGSSRTVHGKVDRVSSLHQGKQNNSILYLSVRYIILVEGDANGRGMKSSTGLKDSFIRVIREVLPDSHRHLGRRFSE